MVWQIDFRYINYYSNNMLILTPQVQMPVAGPLAALADAYSQQEEEGERSPSPPKIGFVGPVVR